VEFGILGPLAVWREGREVELGPAKQRALLAVLLLHEGEAMATERLVDALWGERPPATAVKALQVYVSQLRKTLGSGVLETRPLGYAVRVQDGALDLRRFERLLEEGRELLADDMPFEAGPVLRQALSLWRGEPLADFRYEAFAQDAIGRLAELRLVALEHRLEADLAVGREAEAVPELETLVREYPLRERLCGLLMLALYRAGRQADALAAYQATRARLVDELGLDPGAPLQQLERQILIHDAALDLDVGPTSEAVRRLTAPTEPAPVDTPQPEAPGARKTVTVVCCDVVAYDMRGGLLDPEALQLVMSRCLEHAGAVVERHGGTLESALDPGLRAVFGVPVVHEDDALRALRAALELVDSLPRLGAQARVGVGTGEVLVGGPSLDRGLVTGDPVVVGNRLEHAAGAGEVLIDEATRERAGEVAFVEPVAPLELPGRAEPVAAYRVVGMGDVPERRHEMRFVGRERELALGRELWARVEAEQRCELLTIVADGGVGKSRLTMELLASIDARVVRGRCLPYGEGITYWPVIEVLEQLQLRPSDEAAATAIRSLLGETGDVSSADEIAWGFRKTLEQAASESPLVVVFDDIHCGEETFLDLLEHVALLSTGFPMLLLCMARPELLERRPSWRVAIRLAPLSDENVEELIPAGIALKLREKIARAAGGNPLFIQEMLAIADETDGEIIVPPTLQALLAARLDQLDPSERSVLERGAVEGEVFHRGALLALAAGAGGVTAPLTALVRKEFVRPDRPELSGEDAFRFHHVLIRDAAYEGLPKSIRAELHERFAEWLEWHGGKLVSRDALLGYHLERSYRYRADLGLVDDELRALGDRAATRLAAAARAAHVRGDSGAASALFASAAELGSVPFERAGYALLHGTAARESGAFAAAKDVLTRVRSDAVEAGWPGLEAGADVQLALLSVRTDPVELASRLQHVGIGALAAFEALEDDRGIALALVLLAQERWIAVSMAEMEDLLDRALAPAERANDQALVAEIVFGQAKAAALGPRPVDDAVARCEGLLERARIIGPMAAARITVILGALEAQRGNASRALALGEEGKAVLREFTLLAVAGAELMTGITALVADDPEQAERELRTAAAELEELGERGMGSTVAAVHARTLLELGRAEEAEERALLALSWSDADDVATQGWARGALARAQAARDLSDAALKNARRAVEITARSDFLSQRGDAYLDLALVLDASGDQPGSRRAAGEALALYESKGNVVGAARAARLHAD
jgi:DNA-binding SARP family transcriptional activator